MPMMPPSVLAPKPMGINLVPSTYVMNPMQNMYHTVSTSAYGNPRQELPHRIPTSAPTQLPHHNLPQNALKGVSNYQPQNLPRSVPAAAAPTTNLLQKFSPRGALASAPMKPMQNLSHKSMHTGFTNTIQDIARQNPKPAAAKCFFNYPEYKSHAYSLLPDSLYVHMQQQWRDRKAMDCFGLVDERTPLLHSCCGFSVPTPDFVVGLAFNISSEVLGPRPPTHPHIGAPMCDPFQPHIFTSNSIPAPFYAVHRPLVRASSRKWTKMEDDKLRQAVSKQGGENNWKRISSVHMAGTGRTDVQCLHRWKKVFGDFHRSCFCCDLVLRAKGFHLFLHLVDTKQSQHRIPKHHTIIYHTSLSLSSFLPPSKPHHVFFPAPPYAIRHHKFTSATTVLPN
jgi:hypothetical protein